MNSETILRPGRIAPDFEQDTTNGSIRFHEWIKGSWCVLFSHSSDADAANVAELAEVARLKPEWSKRGVRVIGLSVGSSDAHATWEKDLQENHGLVLNFPVIADADRSVSTLYCLRVAGANLSPDMRHVYVIDPDKKLRLVQTYAAVGGRDFTDVLRAVDDLQGSNARNESARLTGARTGQDVPNTLATQA